MGMAMDVLDYFYIFVAYVVAAFIKGLTSIGFSTSCLPIMALRLDLITAIPLVILPSIVSNLAVMVQAGQFGPALRRFWPMFCATLPGLLLGLWGLTTAPPKVTKAVLGMVLVVYALWALKNQLLLLPSSLEKRLALPTGFLTGVVNGLTGSQVMPVLPFLLSLGLSKALFVQAINISFTLSSLVMLVGMSQLGLVTGPALLTGLTGLAPVLVTVWLAGKIQQRLGSEWHRRLVLIFLLGMGTILVGKLFS